MSNNQSQSNVEQSVDTLIKKPRNYKVILLNDDFTPMEFVIEVLKIVFNKDSKSAEEITMSIHHNGRGICGVFPRDLADTMIGTVEQMSNHYKYPLKAIAEAE